MKYFVLSILTLLISCDSTTKKKEIPLTFVEKSLLKDSVGIDLPLFEHGLPFIENDSTTYLNIYLINDSVVQIGNEKFTGFDQIKSPYSWSKNIQQEESVTKKIKNKERTDSLIINSLKSVKLREFQINIFTDTSVNYGTLDKIYSMLFKYVNNSNRIIRLIDMNNNFLEVRHSIIDTSGIPYCGPSSYFDILINKSNYLLIKGKFGLGFNEISESVKNWYTNDEYWGLDKVTEKTCRKNILVLKKYLSESKDSNTIYRSLKNWKKKLKTTQLIGSYYKVPSFYSITILADRRVEINNYFKILDNVNLGLLELRNELCLKKFDIQYLKLNLTLSREEKIKAAIDEVYPVIINPIIIRPISNLPPPPPPEPPPLFKH